MNADWGGYPRIGRDWFLLRPAWLILWRAARPDLRVEANVKLLAAEGPPSAAGAASGRACPAESNPAARLPSAGDRTMARHSSRFTLSRGNMVRLSA